VSNPLWNPAWPGYSADLLPAREARSLRDLCEEGQRLEREGRFAEAREEYERALRCIDREVGMASASTIVRWIARTYQADARFDEALDVLELAYCCAELEHDERALGHAENLNAIIWWRRGNLEEARRLYFNARDRALRNGDTLLAAMTAQNLGVIASTRGEADQATTYFESSLREYRQLGMHRDACIALNNLGLLQTRLGRWESAERAYQEAVALSDKYGYEDLRTQLDVNLAALTVARGDYKRAHTEVSQALSRARSRDDMAAVAEALKLAGIVARTQGNSDLAEVHFRDAEAIAAARQNILLQAELARESAQLYRALGRNRDLLRSLNQAHRFFGQLQARPDLADIERATRDLEVEFIEVARRWGESTESKDRYTQGHCERVADVACALARRAGLDDTALFWFRIGTLLHDVGKLVIPEEVLNKPGRLTADEWTLVKQHPVAGVELLSGIEFPWDVIPIVRSHHEYWDGSGYPDGLVGHEIPLVARIVCLADVYDALTSERSYKRSLPHAQAMELMGHDVGRQFDPALFALFRDVMAERHPSVVVSETPIEESSVTASPDERASATDELTGLRLRRAFVDEASKMLGELDHDSGALTLAVIDVDSFKSVNDTFGHLQGDDVLRAVAAELLAGIREGDLAGRYAGDEFVLLLRADGREATQVAERLRESVSRLRIPLRGTEEGAVNVSLSIGLSAAPRHGYAFEALFAAADRALYDSKRRGRNLVTMAGSEGAAGKPKLELDRFVGRTAEVTKLVAHFEAAVRGEPRAIAIVGEAGVGKTTLVRRITSDVRLRTGVMVFGRSQEPDVRPPYGPWMDVIAGLHGMGILPQRRWPELERLVPRLRLAETPEISGTPGSKYALLDEIVEFLRLAALQRPLVVVLDDMQWGDTASWDAVEHVVTLLEGERILICLTIRREDADRIDKSRQRLSRSERYHELHLGRLLPAEVRSWLLGALQQPSVEDELPDVLYRYTEGNPLFVKQVLQALFDEGLLWHSGVGWEWREIDAIALPTAVDDLLNRRLARLSPAATKALAVAAVLGRAFDIEDVTIAASASEDQMLDVLDEGIAAGVIEPSTPGHASTFSFVHGLLADSLKRGLNPRRLQQLQRKVAETLEVRRPYAFSEIASLYDQGGNAEKAYDFALRAGERASAVYALDDAMRSLRIAVRCASDADQRMAARIKLLQVTQVAGHYVEAERVCEEIIEEGTAMHSPSVCIAASRTRLEVRMLHGEPLASTLDAARALLSAAREIGVQKEIVWLLTMISDLHARLGDWDQAQRLAREAVEAAGAQDDQQLTADTTIRLGTAVLESSPAEALGHFRVAAAMYATAGNRFGQVRCLVNSGIAHSQLGALADAELAYREAEAMAESAHVIDLGGLAALNLGVLLTRDGRFDEARGRFNSAMAAFKKVKNEPRRLATLHNLANLAREEGDAAAAASLSRAAYDLATELGLSDIVGGALAGVGLAALALGNLDEARSIADRLLVSVDQGSTRTYRGREIVDAFFTRYHLAHGDVETAAKSLRIGAEAVANDVYGFCWLIAECAPLLRGQGGSDFTHYILRARQSARAFGFRPLAKRLDGLEVPAQPPTVTVA
jgi:diguanylate cyclase (GGDEF)-like protein/putative nucleotidyltransferase with HDIG domain